MYILTSRQACCGGGGRSATSAACQGTLAVLRAGQQVGGVGAGGLCCGQGSRGLPYTGARHMPHRWPVQRGCRRRTVPRSLEGCNGPVQGGQGFVRPLVPQQAGAQLRPGGSGQQRRGRRSEGHICRWQP